LQATALAQRALQSPGAAVYQRLRIGGTDRWAAVRAIPGAPGGEMLLWGDRPVWAIGIASWTFWGLALAAIATVVIATAIFRAVLQRSLTRRIETVATHARRLATGQLSARPEIDGSDEFSSIAQSLNEACGRWSADLESLDRQRRMLLSLLDQLHEGVVVVRMDGRIALMNPAAIRLLNVRAADESHPLAFEGALVEQVVSQHTLQRLLRHDGSVGRSRSGDQEEVWSDVGDPAESNGQSVDRVPMDEAEARLQLERAGVSMHVLARASDLVLPNADGAEDASVGRLLVLTDITELNRTIQMKADFVANASHELRTPLSNIRAAVETLLQMDLRSEPDEAGRFLNIVDRHSTRLTAMVSDLLELARLESPEAVFEHEPVNPHDLMNEIGERFASAIESKGVLFSAHCALPSGDAIDINPRLIRLALDNLVENAIKFTESGKRVMVECRREDDLALFTVRDEGCGIPESEQERVFERFYQVERARSGMAARGTGLGLSIVRHAVAAMRGSVSLRSRVGEGTEVTLRVS
jgi:two-component system phosphate regulon sensor histidine kinase PhoR